jgi:hypothetical protein
MDTRLVEFSTAAKVSNISMIFFTEKNDKDTLMRGLLIHRQDQIKIAKRKT